jgi:hypothetical protein
MRKAKLKIQDDTPRIKVQLDYRTIITVKSRSAVDMWLSKYPEAKILDK